MAGRHDASNKGNRGDDSLRLAMLQRIYEVHAEWAGRFPVACGPGCSACCTSSVTMTTLEGRLLAGFLQGSHQWRQTAAILRRLGPSGMRPAETFNHCASLCLAQVQPANVAEDVWDLAPCFLLDEDGRCTVYPARPFACRGFASLARCEPDGGAEVAPLLITINTVVLQLIEHLDSGGGCWGNMIDILRMQDRQETGMADPVLPARPLPGFLVPPGETKEIDDFLHALSSSTVEGHLFGSLLAGVGGGTFDNQAAME